MMARGAVWSMVALVGGCSLWLDPEVDNLPCDELGLCDAGYSCLVNTCIEEHSLPSGNTCSADVQCEGTDAVCGAAPFTCRTLCHTPWVSGGECDVGEYCRPEPASFAATAPRSSCMPSECSNSGECFSGDACADIEPTAGACLAPCEYMWVAGVYSDSCVHDSVAPTYCQAIGLSGSPTLACLELTGDDDGGLEGQGCDPVTAPCRVLDAFNDERGLICHDQVCRQLCDGAGEMCDGEACCPAFVGTGSPAYSICKPSC